MYGFPFIEMDVPVSKETMIAARAIANCRRISIEDAVGQLSDFAYEKILSMEIRLK
jgi:hypothetical protein